MRTSLLKFLVLTTICFIYGGGAGIVPTLNAQCTGATFCGQFNGFTTWTLYLSNFSDGNPECRTCANGQPATIDEWYISFQYLGKTTRYTTSTQPTTLSFNVGEACLTTTVNLRVRYRCPEDIRPSTRSTSITVPCLGGPVCN